MPSMPNKTMTGHPFSRSKIVFPDTKSYTYQKSRQNDKIIRGYFEQESTERNGGAIFMVTLTYKNDAMPMVSRYFPDFSTFWTKSKLDDFERQFPLSRYAHGDKLQINRFSQFMANVRLQYQHTGKIDFPCHVFAHLHDNITDSKSHFANILRFRYGARLRYIAGAELGEGGRSHGVVGSRGEGNNVHWHLILFISPLSLSATERTTDVVLSDYASKPFRCPTTKEVVRLIKESWQFPIIGKDSEGHYVYDDFTDTEKEGNHGHFPGKYQSHVRFGSVHVECVTGKAVSYTTKYATKTECDYDVMRDEMFRFYCGSLDSKRLKWSVDSLYNYYLYLAHNISSFGHEGDECPVAPRMSGSKLRLSKSIRKVLTSDFRRDFIVTTGLHEYWLWRNYDRSKRLALTFQDYVYFRWLCVDTIRAKRKLSPLFGDECNEDMNPSSSSRGNDYRYYVPHRNYVKTFFRELVNGLPTSFVCALQYSSYDCPNYLPMTTLDHISYCRFMRFFEKDYKGCVWRDYYNHFSTRFRNSYQFGESAVSVARNLLAGDPSVIYHDTTSVKVMKSPYVVRKVTKDIIRNPLNGSPCYVDNYLGKEHKMNSLKVDSANGILPQMISKAIEFYGVYRVHNSVNDKIFFMDSVSRSNLIDYLGYNPTESQVNELAKNARRFLSRFTSAEYVADFVTLKMYYEGVYRHRAFYHSPSNINDVIGESFGLQLLYNSSIFDSVVPSRFAQLNGRNIYEYMLDDYSFFLDEDVASHYGKWIEKDSVLRSRYDYYTSNSAKCSEFSSHPVFASLVGVFAYIDMLMKQYSRHKENRNRVKEKERLDTRSAFNHARFANM